MTRKRILILTADAGFGHRSTANALARAFAVSYTHLRAHETVLDLVCRLLLEKTQSLPLQYLTALHKPERLD